MSDSSVQLAMTPEGGIVEQRLMPITVSDPLAYDAWTLLQAIEQGVDSFTEGRRNDDLVNWFLIKRIHEIQQAPSIEHRKLMKYVDAFHDLKLSSRQRTDLQYWDRMTPERKIEQLYLHYGMFNTPEQLAYYWVPMCYQMLGT
jgi:hypothetical protein